MNKHSEYDLAQMQSLPLEAKIRMTQQRIRVWYESWWTYEIHNEKTGKTRYVTFDRRDYNAEPPLRENEYIENAYEGGVYLSFSGGKDSTVLKHIIDSMGYDIPAVFVNTGLEYPEIQQFVREIKAGKYDCFNSNVEIIRPEMRFDEVIKTYGYPVVSKEVSQVIEEARKNATTGKYIYRVKKINGELLDKNGNKSKYNCEKWKFLMDSPFKISNKCCDVMKKKPTKKYEKETGRLPIIGTMAEESRLRKQLWIKNGCNAFDSQRPKSQPLSFWTEQDILHYIKKYNVPYCPAYGEIKIKENTEELDGQINLIDYLESYEPTDILETTKCKRTGCMFCMFGCHLEKQPNRFQKMKVTHPKQYEYCMEKLGPEMFLITSEYHMNNVSKRHKDKECETCNTISILKWLKSTEYLKQLS